MTYLWTPRQKNLPTYSAGPTAGVTFDATPTDVFTLSGVAGAIVRLLRIRLSVSQTTAGNVSILLVKRSAVNTGGTSATRAAVPHISSYPAASATCRTYTVNPTGLGAQVGTVIRFEQLWAVPASAGTTADGVLDWEFGREPDEAVPTLRGAEVLAINFASVTVTGGSLRGAMTWCEAAI